MVKFLETNFANRLVGDRRTFDDRVVPTFPMGNFAHPRPVVPRLGTFATGTLSFGRARLR